MRRLLPLLLLTACGADPQLPPTGKAAIEQWLAVKLYDAWACEPAAHGPRNGSPHGATRICSNGKLSGHTGALYPAGAATVKELFNPDGSLVGRAVLRKLDELPVEASWYFYEIFEGRIFADGAGASACTGCHARAGTSGLPGKDFVFTQVD